MSGLFGQQWKVGQLFVNIESKPFAHFTIVVQHIATELYKVQWILSCILLDPFPRDQQPNMTIGYHRVEHDLIVLDGHLVDEWFALVLLFGVYEVQEVAVEKQERIEQYKSHAHVKVESCS